MLIPKQTLKEILWGDSEEGKVIEDIIKENSRWSIRHWLIFQYKDKYYKTGYSSGATEYQDEQPFQYDPDQIECREVHQVEKLVKVWKNI